MSVQVNMLCLEGKTSTEHLYCWVKLCILFHELSDGFSFIWSDSSDYLPFPLSDFD